MKPEKDPVVIDLAARRKSAQQARAAARKKPARPAAAGEPLLGRRPGAGRILAIVAFLALALWLGPMVLR